MSSTRAVCRMRLKCIKNATNASIMHTVHNAFQMHIECSTMCLNASECVKRGMRAECVYNECK